MDLPKINLAVSVDVEEDNWGFTGSRPTVENIRMISRLQGLFDRRGIKPTYLVTYPVASQGWAVDLLGGILSSGKCEIGAHLHPWNTPPVREEINERNSMLKNLPYELQLEKLNALTGKIRCAFGRQPRSFRAGRWGLGGETVNALIGAGYLVESSVTPMMSWVDSGDGPDYPDSRTEPYWLPAEWDAPGADRGRRILEFPATIGFNRWPFDFWQGVYARLRKESLSFLHLSGLLHCAGLLRKIWLSPEISSARDMIDLSRLMMEKRLKFLNLSFHSTTLLPGKGPFVRDDMELELFYSRLGKFLDYLASHSRLKSLTLSEVGELFYEPASRSPLKDDRYCCQAAP